MHPACNALSPGPPSPTSASPPGSPRLITHHASRVTLPSFPFLPCFPRPPLQDTGLFPPSSSIRLVPYGHSHKTELTREALSIAQANRLHRARIIMQAIERFRGCLLGLTIGDAVGTTLEFQPPGSFASISDMVGGGSFHLKPGYW